MFVLRSGATLDFLSQDEDPTLKVVRLIAYYVFWRSEHLGPRKIGQVMGLSRETVRRYGFYNFLASEKGQKPTHSYEALDKLATYCGDDLPLIFYAAKHASETKEFISMVEKGRLMLKIEKQGVQAMLNSARNRVLAG